MSNKVVITCDSSCDLGPKLCERYHINLNPFRINVGDETFLDGVNITPDDLYAYHEKTGLLSKTSATNVAEHEEFFKQNLKDADELIFFTISSSMSVNYQNACIAAESFNNVYVVDSGNLSSGVGLLVLTAADLAEQGKSAKEIIAEVERLRANVNASFVIDTLEFLHKGGRCSALAALGANLLKLKPCIEVKNGAMGVAKKYRGKFAEVLKTYAKERLENPDNLYLNRVFITHAGCDPKIAEEIAALVKELAPFNEVFITRAGATVSTHCGPNTLGVLFIQKTPVE